MLIDIVLGVRASEGLGHYQSHGLRRKTGCAAAAREQRLSAAAREWLGMLLAGGTAGRIGERARAGHRP
jgi:hypothetical protein